MYVNGIIIIDYCKFSVQNCNLLCLLVQELIALRAIRDVNVPKFLMDDLKLFNGIVSDLFPNIESVTIKLICQSIIYLSTPMLSLNFCTGRNNYTCLNKYTNNYIRKYIHKLLNK